MAARGSEVGVTMTVTYTILSVVFTGAGAVVVHPAASITAIHTKKRITPLLFFMLISCYILIP
jgi:hypothetical protein